MYLDHMGKVDISLSGELSHLPATTFSQVQCSDDWHEQRSLYPWHNGWRVHGHKYIDSGIYSLLVL
jgi:hypothetical protein